MSNTRMVVLTLMVATSALAQNSRSAVSSTGLDTNPCTITSPCRSFNAAIAVTYDHGEIVAFDSAGYGPVVIGKSIDVSGAPGVHAAISSTAGADAIDVIGTGLYVGIRNLVLIGGSGEYGIKALVSAGSVHIADCLIRDFSAGIFINNGDATIERSVISRGGDGIYILGPRHVVISDCVIEENNVGNGIEVSLGGEVSILRSTITRKSTGISADSSVVSVKDSVVTYNPNGVGASGTGALYLNNCMLNYNTIPVVVSGTDAAVYTYGNNQLNNNGEQGSAMTPVGLE